MHGERPDMISDLRTRAETIVSGMLAALLAELRWLTASGRATYSHSTPE
jgi:hypothetical protein